MAIFLRDIRHDILDFCVRELGALGGGGAIIDACSCQAVHRSAIVAGLEMPIGALGI